MWATRPARFWGLIQISDRRPSSLLPTFCKSAKDGAPELLWLVESGLGGPPARAGRSRAGNDVPCSGDDVVGWDGG
jgi:hypothetical protein